MGVDADINNKFLIYKCYDTEEDNKCLDGLLDDACGDDGVLYRRK